MRRNLLLVLVMSIFLFSGFLPKETVRAFLLKKNTTKKKYDTIKTFTVNAIANQKTDLLFCIKHFDYPPNLPKHFQLQSSPSPFRTFNQKSIYDERGRIIKYYYHGSMVSGIIPYGYDFIYENDTSFTIRYLTDKYEKSIYQIFYNSKNNIERIEYSDSSGVIEKMMIQLSN